MHSSAHLLSAFALTLFAGLATIVGSVMAFFSRRTNPRLLSVALGFSAGVMIYVSFTEILVKAGAALAAGQGGERGAWITVLAFFGGIAVAGLIDRLVPTPTNPHEIRRVEEIPSSGTVEPGKRAGLAAGPADTPPDSRLMRMGLFSAIAIAVHNFPEGLATFAAALRDPALGISIAIAIAIHNIPEGIAVAVPIFYATGSRRKAFAYSALSGLAEPLGAIIGYVILRQLFSDAVFGVLFASVAGIMVFISLDELLPAAREFGEHHLSIYGLIGGMAVMALSLLLL